MDSKTDKLPDKISDLLEVAVDDVIKIKRRKSYALDMFNWHLPAVNPRNSSGKCTVCMAGAVMANRFPERMKEYNETCPSDFDEDTEKKLDTINCLRKGFHYDNDVQIDEALRPIRVEFSPILGMAPIKAYRQAIKNLRKIGF